MKQFVIDTLITFAMCLYWSFIYDTGNLIGRLFFLGSTVISTAMIQDTIKHYNKK
jgi:hypothetical protein